MPYLVGCAPAASPGERSGGGPGGGGGAGGGGICLLPLLPAQGELVPLALNGGPALSGGLALSGGASLDGAGL